MGRQALCRHPQRLPRFRRRRERSASYDFAFTDAYLKPIVAVYAAVLPPRRHDRELPSRQPTTLPRPRTSASGHASASTSSATTTRAGPTASAGTLNTGKSERAREPAPVAGDGEQFFELSPRRRQPPQVVLSPHQGGRLRQLRLLRLRRSRKGKGQVLLQFHNLVRGFPRPRPGTPATRHRSTSTHGTSTPTPYTVLNASSPMPGTSASVSTPPG